MLTITIHGPGVTEASTERAGRLIDQLLATSGVRLWHAAKAAHLLPRWESLWFGHANVPELPDAMCEARRVWWQIEDLVVELCGAKADTKIVGELEVADEQLPWPPLAYPPQDDEEAEIQRLVDAGAIKVS